jgi:hypothetical protein
VRRSLLGPGRGDGDSGRPLPTAVRLRRREDFAQAREGLADVAGDEVDEEEVVGVVAADGPRRLLPVDQVQLLDALAWMDDGREGEVRGEG